MNSKGRMKKPKTTTRKSQVVSAVCKVEETGASEPQHTTLEQVLMPVIQSEAFTELDRQFAKFMARLAGTNQPAFVLAVAMLSRARADGHACLDLRTVAGTVFPSPTTETVRTITCPDIESWVNALRATAVVGAPGEFKPLILDQAGRLYLHRYWEYEAALANELQRRASAQTTEPSAKTLAKLLDKLFPRTTEADEPDWQRIAVQVAVQRQLCVITGGPGTGKTWTLVRILALLIELTNQKPIQIAVAAPTGKAAARLQEEIRKAKLQLTSPEAVKAQLPERAMTIHRLLGASRDATSFRFNRTNPLPFDVVAVDETGMVDLALMARLVDALVPQAKLILLGDKDQLASVEPGAVLGDICAGLDQAVIQRRAKWVANAVGDPRPTKNSLALAECIVQLQKNYRFSSQSQIYRLSQAVNAGDAARAIKILGENVASAECAVTWVQLPGYTEMKTVLKERLLAGFAEYFAAQTPADALSALSKFRVLCALREGPFGIVQINRLAEQIFEEAGLVTLTGPFYVRRAVMITRNDYNIQLFNGDVGVILPSQEKPGHTNASNGSKHGAIETRHFPQATQPVMCTQHCVSDIVAKADNGRGRACLEVSHEKLDVRAFFAGTDGSLRAVLPTRLPEHQTAYAITVHKSQGSEFDHVLMIMPDRDVPLLTRELIYTAITRARKTVEIWATEPVLVAAIERRTTRSSGLRDALWQIKPSDTAKAC